MQATRISTGGSTRRDRSTLFGTSRLAKLGVVGLSLAFLTQVTGLCLCLAGSAAASCGMNGCCPVPTAPPASAVELAATAPAHVAAGECCLQSLSARDRQAEQRSPSAASQADPGAATARVDVPRVAAPLAAASRSTASSSPRSLVLRI